MEISKFTAWGCPVKEVADKLGISFWTVKNTLKKVYAKLGITNSNELTAFIMCKEYGARVEEDFIGNVKRAIGAYVLLLLFGFQLVTCDQDIYRARRARRRGKDETEFVEF